MNQLPPSNAYQDKLSLLDIWPCSALDKKRDVIRFSPCAPEDFETLKTMYDTFEPKLAVQGLPPLDTQTRTEWIFNNLSHGVNIKADLNGNVVAHGLLHAMSDLHMAEFGLFVHNRYQHRGLGLLLANVLITVGKNLGFDKLWVSEERGNSRAINLYLKCGFKKITAEAAEMEFVLDLATAPTEIDLSERIMPLARPSGLIKAPDYLADQDLYDDTRSVFIFSPQFEKLQMPPDHPFTTQRSRLALDLMARFNLTNLPGTQIMGPETLDENSILSYHDRQYYYYLTMMTQAAFVTQMLEYGLGTPDCPIIPGMLGYAALAAGASVMGADMLLKSDNVSLVFSPTGGFHHAGLSYAAGFCYISDVVLAIRYLLQEGVKKILYVDIDAHHGDGVQYAFYDDPRVLNISLHESGRTLFPWTSGFENELGDGPGYGYNINVPLAPGTNDEIYREAFERVAVPAARAFGADICVAVIGVDSMYSDPLTHLSLTNNVFSELILKLRTFAPKLLLLGGGGYNPDNLARDWTLAWAVLHDAEPTADYYGQVGMLAHTSEMNTGDLRDSYPFIPPMRLAEASAEAHRVINYLEEYSFPVIGVPTRFRPAQTQSKASRIFPCWFINKRNQVVNLRLFQPRDYPLLEDMYDRFEPKGMAQGLPPVDKTARRQWLKKITAMGHHVMAWVDGKLAGQAVLFDIREGDCAEWGIFIHQDYQGTGIGKRLTRLSKLWAAELGYQRVWLVVARHNRRAVTVFTKCGFQATHGFDTEIDMNLPIESEVAQLARGVLTPPDASEFLAQVRELAPLDNTTPAPAVFIHNEFIKGLYVGQHSPFVAERSYLPLCACRTKGLLDPDFTNVYTTKPLNLKLASFQHCPDYLFHLFLAGLGVATPAMANCGLDPCRGEIFVGVDRFALQSAGASLMAARLIEETGAKIVFNPCGGFPHARRDDAGRFCFINDVAFAIRYLNAAGRRVLYIDLGLNGERSPLPPLDNPRLLLTCALRPDTSADSDNIADTLSAGAPDRTVFLALPPGLDDESFLMALDGLLTRLKEAFRPDVCVLLLNVNLLDATASPHINISRETFTTIITRIAGLAPKTLALGGGGQNEASITMGLALAWAALTAPVRKDGEDHVDKLLNHYRDVPEAPRILTQARKKIMRERIARAVDAIAKSLSTD